VAVEPVLGKPVSVFPMFVVAHSSGLREACWTVSNSFQVKEFVGNWFLPESAQHQLQALRLPDLACFRDPEREVSTDGLCVLRCILSGGTGMWGMRVWQ
jgi:hypothetical protein